MQQPGYETPDRAFQKLLDWYSMSGKSASVMRKLFNNLKESDNLYSAEKLIRKLVAHAESEAARRKNTHPNQA